MRQDDPVDSAYANHLFHNSMKCLAQALISVVYLRLTAKLHFMGSNKKPKQRLRCGNYNYQLFTVKCRRFIDEGREEKKISSGNKTGKCRLICLYCRMHS